MKLVKCESAGRCKVGGRLCETFEGETESGARMLLYVIGIGVPDDATDKQEKLLEFELSQLGLMIGIRGDGGMRVLDNGGKRKGDA